MCKYFTKMFHYGFNILRTTTAELQIIQRALATSFRSTIHIHIYSLDYLTSTEMGLANWKVIVLCSSHLRWLGKCVHMWHWREKKPDCYPQKAHGITTNIIPGEIQSSWRRGTNKEMWLRLSVQRRHLASHRSLRDVSIYRVSKCQYGAILMQMGLQTCHVVRACYRNHLKRVLTTLF